MGTRADFYVGRGKDAEWIGSIAFDGYPSGIQPKSAETIERWAGYFAHPDEPWADGEHLFDAATAEAFRERFARFIMHRRDVTLPKHGWPWPWETSRTTDFAYAFDGGRVYASCFGKPWFDPRVKPDDDDEGDADGVRPEFPDMTERQNVTYGDRSGLIVIAAPSDP